jgi:hypothetical protein
MLSREIVINWLGGVILALLTMLTATSANAVPSFARQMGGMQCAACHTVFPELTPFGRQFKLRGFSMSAPKPDNAPFFDKIPVSALLQISQTLTRYTGTAGATSADFPRDDNIIVQTAGLYYAGKITDKSGALVQYNYDGIERRWGMEMADIRYAGTATLGKELVYGITLNNNPTVSDIYNSTPVWGFPNVGSAAVMPAASTMLDMTLQSQVGGVGVYGLWDNLLYGEVALYRTANTGAFRPLGLGVPTDNIVKGSAPYWRFALQRESGAHSFAVGTYGMIGKIYADNQDFSLGTNRFKDIGLDGQYQFIDGDHTFSTHANWIHEKQELNASFPMGAASNASNVLRTFRADVRYNYKRQWGGGLQYFQTRGDTDTLRYNDGEMMAMPVMGSANGSPNNKGWVAELNFLPRQDIKLALRYTAYTQFNGASNNYDGFGRDASDNNSLYLLSWLMF